MKGSTESRSSGTAILFLFLLLLSAVRIAADEPAGGCGWQRGQSHAMHWPQLPDLGSAGSDVSLTSAILADDFLCTVTGPVRGIHIWGSFADDALPKEGPDALTLELSLYSDVPADDQKWSQPGTLLWSQTFEPGTYSVQECHDGPEDWYDPATGLYAADNHRKAYQYDFCIEDDPFVQQEGVVYWLMVQVTSESSNYEFGWKTTSQQWRWNDSAVYLSDVMASWLPMAYPAAHRYAEKPLGLAFVITGDAEAGPQHELGDAPDSSNSLSGMKMLAYANGTGGSFPTVYQAGSPPYGPLHQRPQEAFYLGTWASRESEADLGPDDDGVNNLDPRNDRANQDADDDGLQLPVIMPHNGQTAVDYTVTMANPVVKQVYVNIWCDWNRDGDWNDTIIRADGSTLSEWVVQDEQPALPGAGTYTFTSAPFTCWHPTGQDDPQPIWVRLTVSEQDWRTTAGLSLVGGAGPMDGYQYGETEDYYLQPLVEAAATEYDWGDASGYPTTLAANGARHIIVGPWLGAEGQAPDGEANGQPDFNALGDDNAGSNDEDGVSIPPLVRGQAASITVSVQGGGGVVQAWIDFDADQAWYDDEQVFDGFLPDGVHVISFAVPDDAVVGQSFARFRISRSGGLDPDGPAPDGEVEDHAVRIDMLPTDLKWCQLPDCTPRGMDIRLDGTTLSPRMMADDFECQSSDRLTHIRLWGSWKDDQKGRIETIGVRVHADDPAGSAGADKTNKFAKPRTEILWEMQFAPGQYEESLYDVLEVAGQWWWDPASGELISNNATELWQIDIDIDPEEAFLQEGSVLAPRIYWLEVEVETSDGQFGWKTRHWPDHALGAAVWSVGNKLPRPWQELRYPEGHRFYDHEKNAIDLAFCLRYTADSSEPATSRPVSVTQCPAIETMCPTTETQCPATVTKCPAVETTCPLTSTACPAFSTRCPSVSTQCPTTVTQCPAVETQCPATETKCPPSVTKCPPVETQCPMTSTTCQAVSTTCPAVETRCPTAETQCPSIQTRCPATETQCPVAVTQCPTMKTQCPVTETQCPTTSTKCPVVQTRCPTVETQCPTTMTKCPATETQCPVVLTKCPTCQIRSTLTTSDGVVVEPCPIVDVPCPTVVDYVSMAMPR